MTRQTIPVSLGGAEYTYPLTITENTGKDISGVTFQMSMGTYDAPGTWGTPSVDTSPSTDVRVLQLLIDVTTPVGSYYLWTKATDSPEVPIRRHDRIDIT